jgi:hypothetical protein
MINLILILIIFIIGLIFFCNNSRLKYIEKFDNINNNNKNCPNILMKKNNQIYLYNNNLAHIPGINPIIFKTLEDYAQFVEWQQSQNIDCPILFLDTTYDTQNNEVYKITSNPFSQSEILLEPELIIPNTNTITPLYNANRSPSSAAISSGRFPALAQ